MIGKKNYKFAGVLLIVILATNFINAQTAQEKDKRTVMDYFEMLYGGEFVEDHDTKIVSNDSKNGYLEINDDGVVKTVALFRTPDGFAIVLVATKECEISCTSAMDAYELIDGVMIDVSTAVLPRLSEREAIEIFKQKRKTKVKLAEEISLVHQLPRKGRVVRIIGFGEDNKDIKLYELHLKGSKFVLVR